MRQVPPGSQYRVLLAPSFDRVFPPDLFPSLSIALRFAETATASAAVASSTAASASTSALSAATTAACSVGAFDGLSARVALILPPEVFQKTLMAGLCRTADVLCSYSLLSRLSPVTHSVREGVEGGGREGRVVER